MADPARLLTIQFLEWVASHSRTYASTMEAWRTSCPRLPVWEDAIENGLVQIERGHGKAMADCSVTLTPGGEIFLNGARTDGAAHMSHLGGPNRP